MHFWWVIMKKIIVSIARSFLLIGVYSPIASFANYLPMGPFWGVSDGALIVKKIDGIIAMEDKQGKKYNLPKLYADVDGFSNGICAIRVRSSEAGLNVLGILSNKAFQKAYYLKEENGDLVRVDIDFLKFKCKKI